FLHQQRHQHCQHDTGQWDSESVLLGHRTEALWRSQWRRQHDLCRLPVLTEQLRHRHADAVRHCVDCRHHHVGNRAHGNGPLGHLGQQPEQQPVLHLLHQRRLREHRRGPGDANLRDQRGGDADRANAKQGLTDRRATVRNQGLAEYRSAKRFRRMAIGELSGRIHPRTAHAHQCFKQSRHQRLLGSGTVRKRGTMAKKNEKGVALILTLILLAVLSVMAISLLFIGQSETWGSMNYRLMTQARYGAEAGLNSAANWIQNSYTTPTAAQIAGMTVSASPVQYSGADVALSTISSKQNYPDSTVQNSFASNAGGSITAGNTTITYNPTATLLGVQSFTGYPAATTNVVQKWLITSSATING